MKRRALLTLLVCYCSFSFSQNLTFTRKFETFGKNVPIAIINSHAHFFYLLRYNKSIHDFTVEQRAKPSGEMMGFTPLKLDQVNSDWFNYEKLDYLFFEQDHKIYFLFEKVLNTKKTIYLKIIDSLHKSSPFIELANLTMDKGLTDIGFDYRQTFDNNILIVASHTYHNSVNKTAMLYNIQKQKMDWVKKLALENDYTGYSGSFACNKENDLFFVLIRSHIASYERRYTHQMQMSVPVIFCDNVTLVSYLHDDPANVHLKPLFNNLSRVNNLSVSVLNEDVILQAHYAVEEEESRYKRVFFSTIRISKDLNREIYANTTTLNKAREKQLTFYDGSDSKYAGDKQYALIKTCGNGSFNYLLSERRDEPYYKELLAVQTDLETGSVTGQQVIMRKSLEAAMTVFNKDNLYIITREASANLKKPAGESKYQKFRKEKFSWGSNIVMYTIGKDGNIGKKLISSDFSLTMSPLNYIGDQQDNIIFCEELKGYERFATFKLDSL